MKKRIVTIDLGRHDVIMFVPMFGIVYDPELKIVEGGFWFWKYFLTLNIELK
jgi:hypothetical protein